MGNNQAPDWNSFARKQAHARWRKQSAAMGRELTELVVRDAAVQPGMRVLDVACGTGEPGVSIATLLDSTGEVIGIDISSEPLTVAHERASQRGLTNISFQQGEAEHLPFADSAFDRATCRLGLMFFFDLDRALAEIHRVLSPGGRFVAATWGPLEQPYLEMTVGTIRRMLPGIEIPSGARSMFKFGDPAALESALLTAGFTEIQASVQPVAWNWEGPPKELWEYFQAVTVPFTPLLNAIPADRKPEVDREVEAKLGLLYDGNVVRQRAYFTIATAVKPSAEKSDK